jgi:hypothetical protein
MSLSSVQTRCNVDAFFILRRDPPSFCHRYLIDIQPAYRLTHDLLFIVQILCRDLYQAKLLLRLLGLLNVILIAKQFGLESVKLVLDRANCFIFNFPLCELNLG